MPRHLDQTVAVGIGLEDGHDSRGGDVALEGVVVGGETGEVDFDLGGSKDRCIVANGGMVEH